MREHCVEDYVELLHILQIWQSEADLRAFHFVFKIDEEKFELPDFWPAKTVVSKFDLNEASRDWLKRGSSLTTSHSTIETTDETKIWKN